MKRFRNSAFAVLLASFFANFIFAQSEVKRCAAGEYVKIKLNKNKNFAKSSLAFNQSIQQCILKNRALNAGRKSAISELIRIPIVVHVIHNNTTNTIGGARNANISDEQVKSQIEVLNEDYRRKKDTRGFNVNPLGTDMNIEFYLAEVDPDGNLTNGIIRKFTEKQTFDPFSDADQLALSKLSYWPSDCYLNIWTTTLANNYLGFSQFPTAKLDGLDDPDIDTEETAKVDGVYIDYKFFGKNSAAITSKYYKYGRTTTHEVGHWLGLIHTWGDDICGDDYIDDTPEAENANLTVVCQEKFSSCSGKRTRNMIENYMDYTIDSCMNIFTIGQRERVEAVFEMSPRRKKLIECVTKLPESETIEIILKNNPMVDNIKADILFKGQFDAEIAIFDIKGNEIYNSLFKNKRSFAIKIPITNLNTGIYVLYANINGQSASKRIYIEGK